MGIYGKITGILREFVFGLSIFFTIVGFIILLIGITGFVEDLNYIPLDIFGFSEDFLPWSFYILAAGAVMTSGDPTSWTRRKYKPTFLTPAMPA